MTFKLITENTSFLSGKQKFTLAHLERQTRPSIFETPKKVYYEISGATFDELYKSLLTEAAKAIPRKTATGKQVTGFTETFLARSGYKFRYKKSGNFIIAYPVGLTIQATTTVTLPRFRGIIALPSDAERWLASLTTLDKHEQGHVCIALDAFNKIKQAFISVIGKGKTQLDAQKNLQSEVNKIYNGILNDNDLKQDKYDADTNHGTKLAEQDRYNKQFSYECNKIYPEI